VDYEGDAGKSWFADYYSEITEKAVTLLPAKKADVIIYSFIQLLDTLNCVVFVDCEKERQGDILQYDVLGDIKNGRVVNTKYQSGMIYFRVPHVW
jgi:hypothetical protein